MLGLSSGPLQLRLSEALTLLPLFLPEAVVGLFVGCLISNIFTGTALDIVLGSLATLIGALGTRLFARADKRLKWWACIPPIISNALIVPLIISVSYGSELSYPLLLLSIFVSELVSAGILGNILCLSLKKAGFDRYLK